jgi:hypothetical protein
MSEPQWSPDRQWWWDGKQWIPAAQAATAKPPEAGPPPTGPPPQKSRSRRPALIIGAIGLLVVFGICTIAVASSGGQKQQAAAKPSPSAAAQAAAKPATPAPAAKPDAGSCAPQPCANDNNGWIVTVSDLKYDAPGGFGDAHKAEPGNVFVTMLVTFTNKKTTEQHANAYNFVLEDGAGVKHTSTYTEGCTGWSAVNVTPGAAYGPKCLAYEATAGKPQGLTLVWTPASFGGGDYRIKLS